MGLTITALLLKWASAWVVVSLFGLVRQAPSPGQAVWPALVLAVVSWVGDRFLPVEMQGISRWLIDSFLAAFVLLLLGAFRPDWAMDPLIALFAGLSIGAVEIPLHYYLAARYGLKARGDGEVD